MGHDLILMIKQWHRSAMSRNLRFKEIKPLLKIFLLSLLFFIPNSHFLTNESVFKLLLLTIHLYLIVLNDIQVVLADGLGNTSEGEVEGRERYRGKCNRS